jgi:DNA repair exonuclease SbcCD ATPase subunit
VGENRDNGGNNGAGKSTLFEAIALALTNKSLRDLKKENFINREAEDCEIKLHMRNDVMKSTLTIERKFFRGNKSARVVITENDEVNSHIVSVDEANKRIYELIGVSREDLLRYFIISQDNNYTFFTAGDTEKKEVLNRITSADIINPILDKLSAEKKAKESEKNDLERQVVTIQSKKDAYIEQIEELENDPETETEIAELERQIIRFKETKKANDENIKTLEKQVKALERERDAIVVPDVTELRSERKKLRDKIDELNKERNENKRIFRLAEQDLDSKITCPHCSKEFIRDSQLNLSVEETENIKLHIKAEDDKLLKKIERLNEKSDAIDEQISETETIEEKRESINRQIRRNTSAISAENDENKTLDKKIRKRTEDIKELREQKRNDGVLLSLKDKVKDCETELKELADKSAKKDEELEMVNYWNYYMGKAGFTTYLANKSVSVLEGTVNSFLKKFKSNLSVNINGFKILRDGTVREKIEVFTLDNGMNAEVFMSKSGGERGRINLAGVLAIQHLINMSTDGKGINFIGLDETFNGIDSEGQESIIKILESIGITVLMITQNVSSEFNNNNKLLVVKEDGVSKFA